jgi:hypothetical protein
MIGIAQLVISKSINKKKPFQKERLPDLGRRYEKLSFFISILFLSATENFSLGVC